MDVIAHGVDLVPVARIEQLLRRHGLRFLERCFSPAEQADSTGRRAAEHLGVRFAAKEAALKALGTGLTGGIRWTDVQVLRRDSGEPMLVVTGRAAEVAAERGISAWLVSLSHAGGFAMASVLAGDSR
ncbi:MAG: holo-ACP synthase [Phycisphaerae bacterium]|nr:holo-ACP synthase [Phycisphaerae bacterium]